MMIYDLLHFCKFSQKIARLKNQRGLNEIRPDQERIEGGGEEEYKILRPSIIMSRLLPTYVHTCLYNFQQQPSILHPRLNSCMKVSRARGSRRRIISMKRFHRVRQSSAQDFPAFPPWKNRAGSPLFPVWKRVTWQRGIRALLTQLSRPRWTQRHPECVMLLVGRPVQTQAEYLTTHPRLQSRSPTDGWRSLPPSHEADNIPRSFSCFKAVQIFEKLNSNM